MVKLSIIIPVYNEVKNIAKVIERVNLVPIEKEIIVVDDNSYDGTSKVLGDLRYENMKVIYHSSNRGKGAAVISGLSQSAGEYVISQDADFEYDPLDYLKLFNAMDTQKADIVLGARFSEEYHGMFLPKLGNRLLTGLLNKLFSVQLNDCFTCYKLMRRESIIGLNLESNGFDIEIEILSKAIKKKMSILEVPISYKPRAYKEGKKIKIRDGIWAIVRIFYFHFF